MDLDNLVESQFLKGLDALYERGGDDQYAGLKFDPRGCHEYQAILDLVRTALTPPEGYVLVPVVPTQEMLDTGWDAEEHTADVPTVWAAMIAARPEVP